MQEEEPEKKFYGLALELIQRLLKRNKRPEGIPKLTSRVEPQRGIQETKMLSPIEIMMGQSAMTIMTMVTRIQAGTQVPYGYEKVAEVFSRSIDKMNGRLYVWLLAEAQIAGQEEIAKQRFPEMEFQARLEINAWKKESPDLVNIILRDASRPKGE